MNCNGAAWWAWYGVVLVGFSASWRFDYSGKSKRWAFVVLAAGVTLLCMTVVMIVSCR